MYLTPRSAQVRNLAVAAVNGSITLIILLIAPLGLAAVLINTALVTVASYATATIADRIVRYLQPDVRRAEFINPSQPSSLQRPNPNDLDRY
jgi:hypothetical protein